MMSQVFLNILYTAFVYLLIALSFSIEYYTTKFFNLFHAIILSGSAYLVYLFTIQLGIPFYLGMILSIVLSSLLGLSSERFVFNPLRKRNAKAFQIMIASLGLYVIFQNLISIVWGDTQLTIRQANIEVGKQVYGGYITTTQISTIAISATLLILFQLLLNFSALGKKLRAVSSNLSLSNIFGINADRVCLYSFLIGSVLASVAGILVAYDTGLTPNMGFNLFLYGAVVMIIGGTGNFKGLIAGAFLLATAQNLGAYFIDSKWLDVVTYITLISFLMIKPMGFSGNRLKKIEL